MANKKFWLGMLVALAFGMTVVGCNDGNGDGDKEEKGGTFVLTDIPAAYNGKYAYFMGGNSSITILGYSSMNMTTETYTLVQIANRKVSLPLWSFSDFGLSKYSGNDTFTSRGEGGANVAIFNTRTYTGEEDPLVLISFQSATFSNGNATKSWNDGFVEE